MDFNIWYIKNNILSVLFIVLLFCSYVTEKPILGYHIPVNELETMEKIGFIETNFEVIRYDSVNILLQKGYNELFIVAKKNTVKISTLEIFL